MLGQQPNILLGSAPSLTVQLECALSTPSAPAAPLPQCSDPADVNPIGCTQPPSPPPRPSPSCLQTNIGCLQTPAALRPGPLPPGATFPAGYPNVACVNGKTYLDQNGHDTLSSERPRRALPVWMVDTEDPQNSPCVQG